MALSNGKLDAVRLLASTPGVDPNATDVYGRSCCNLASYKKSTDFLRAVFDMPGVDVNKDDNNGESILMSAVDSARVDAVRLLLTARGIDINKRAMCAGSRNGKTALGLAVACAAEEKDKKLFGRRHEVVALLRAAGARE